MAPIQIMFLCKRSKAIYFWCGCCAMLLVGCGHKGSRTDEASKQMRVVEPIGQSQASVSEQAAESKAHEESTNADDTTRKRPAKKPGKSKRKAEKPNRAAAEQKAKTPEATLNNDYVKLARSLSLPYSINGLLKETGVTEAVSLEELKRSPITALKAVGERFQRVQTEIADVGRNATSANSKIAAEHAGVLDAAGNGEFTRTEQVMEKNADGTVSYRDVTVDASTTPVLMSTMLSSVRQSALREEATETSLRLAQIARADSWRLIADNLDSVYSAPRRNESVIEIKIEPKIEGATAIGKFEAVNRSKKVLHNVTLVIETVHFLACPDICTRDGYFIEVWRPNESIQIQHNLVFNCDPPELREYRPHVARVDNWKPWRLGVGGIVEVRTIMGADELCQEQSSTHFLSQAEEGAEFELTCVGKVLLEEYWHKTKKDKQYEMDTLPSWCERAVGRIRYLAPNDKQLMAYVDLATKNPHEFVRKWRREAEDRALSMLQAGKMYAGHWSLQQLDSNKTQRKSAGVEAFLKDHSSDEGRIALRIDASPNKENFVIVTFFDPQDASRYREYRGVLKRNLSSEHYIDLMSSDPDGPPRGRLTDKSAHPLGAAGKMRVFLQEEAIYGTQFHQRYEQQFHFRIDMTSASDDSFKKVVARLNATKPTNQETTWLKQQLGVKKGFIGKVSLTFAKDPIAPPLREKLNQEKGNNVTMRISNFDDYTRVVDVEFEQNVAVRGGMGNRVIKNEIQKKKRNGIVMFDASNRSWFMDLPSTDVEGKSNFLMPVPPSDTSLSMGNLDLLRTAGAIRLYIGDRKLTGSLDVGSDEGFGALAFEVD